MDTSKIALDTGAYTIYTTSVLTNGKASDATETTVTQYGEKCDDGKYYAVKLSDSEYATVLVNLKQPFLSAVPSETVIAQGDKLYVRGTAEGDPNNLILYIFSLNFFEPFTITVEDNDIYEKRRSISATRGPPTSTSSLSSTRCTTVCLTQNSQDIQIEDTWSFKINNDTHRRFPAELLRRVG